MKVRKKLLLCLLSVLLVSSMVFLYFAEFPIKMEYVTSLEMVNNPVHVKWYSIRDKEYAPFYDVSLLEEQTNINLDNLFDTDNYTYIVVMGYEADSLKFSFSEMKNRKYIIIPKQYVGIITFGQETSDKINIYRIRKLDIDSDVHQSSRNVRF